MFRLRPYLRATPCLVVAFSVFPATSLSAEENATLSFNHDIRPILSENCFHCHGQDEKEREADLRLDTVDGALADLGGYAALVPGDPSESELYLRVTSEYEDEVMPPPNSNRQLTDVQRELLRQWIEQGGEYDTHWAFVSPRKTNPGESGQDPIDYFVQNRLSAEGLEPSTQASPSAWLRRVSFDLTGLPPSPQEVDTFVVAVDRIGEQAYADKVDELLASPRFGERLASDWLDASRYADTHGFNNDSSRTMWRWRDWVIDAFNENKPYDQFITEQLAGDLLPSPTLEQRIATGFNRNHGINSEGGIIDEEYRVEYVADRVRTVGMTWMGLTTECARCHDHKYDPFTQEDYYRMFAFFNNVEEIGEDGRVANAVPMIPSPTQAQSEELEILEQIHDQALDHGRQIINALSLNQSTLETVLARNAAHSTSLPEPVWTLSEPDSSSEESPLEDASAPTAAPGIRSLSFASSDEQSIGAIKAKTNEFEEKTNAFAIAFWIRPNSSNPTNAPLISNATYGDDPSSQSHGKGWDIRLIDGEVQFTIANRYPAYSIKLRTRDAKITSEEWRHLAVSFLGRKGLPNAYTPASRFRIYVDGIESRLDVLHDDLQDFPSRRENPTLLGKDLFPQGVAFQGRMDEIKQYGRSLNSEQIAALFETEAIAYLNAQSTLENDREWNWAKRIALSSSDDSEWADVEAIRQSALDSILEVERSIPTTMIMQERSSMRDTFVLDRGLYDSPKQQVEPGVPEDWLVPWPEDAPLNRLGFAQWLTRPDHPLTARVVVNRFWQQFFGIGIVKTSEDFGIQAEFPSHPELLDWLAVDFVESGWDVKKLLKRIALSQTYRQDSTVKPELHRKDPENRLLARGPRFRLPAESIRDQALAISGLLNETIGGPSVHPYQPKDLYKGTVVGAAYPSTKWIQSEGDDLYRRSLYIFWKRTVPHPLMTTFDAPDREVCSVRRSSTNTPLQALSIMNGPTFVEAARAMAEQALEGPNSLPSSRLNHAFQLATGRLPNESEATTLSNALEQMLDSFSKQPEEAEAFIAVGQSSASGDHDPIELAAYAAVMSLILNLDETLTKG